MYVNDGDFIRCHCGRLYKFYTMTAADQSQCGKCATALKDEYAKQCKADEEDRCVAS
jgi:hypothetical protein